MTEVVSRKCSTSVADERVQYILTCTSQILHYCFVISINTEKDVYLEAL